MYFQEKLLLYLPANDKVHSMKFHVGKVSTSTSEKQNEAYIITRLNEHRRETLPTLDILLRILIRSVNTFGPVPGGSRKDIVLLSRQSSEVGCSGNKCE